MGEFVMWKVLCVIISVGGCLAFEEIQLTNGVRLIETSSPEYSGRSSDGSLSSHLHQFFSTHELQLKLDKIIPQQGEIERSLKGALDYLNGLDSEDDESGRKGGGGGGLGGGKKGGGAILMMATMMGGTMAALGFGAVGMLAMKALTVSAMAFMLSAVIGLKKLLSKGDDEGGHSVSYIPVHHGGGGGGGHRRRRSAFDLAYGKISPQSIKS